MRLLSAITFLLFLNPLFAKEQTDSFMVSIWDHSIKVVAPDKVKGFTSVIIENKTLNDIKAELTEGGEVLTFISIPIGVTRSVEVRYKEDRPLALVPLSPPFQEVYLKAGQKSYEIPPRLER